MTLPRVIRTPGRLVLEPTSLASAFPYGGTELGVVEALYLSIREYRSPLAEEGLGRRVVIDQWMTGESWALLALLAEPAWDTLDGIIGGSSGASGKLLTTPAANRALGQLLASDGGAKKVLFAPRDDREPFIYLARALIGVSQDSRIPHSIHERRLIPFTAVSTPSTTSAKAGAWGFKGDITL